jgi:hypothetical protein
MARMEDHLQPGSATVIVLVKHPWRHSVVDLPAGQEGFVFQQPLTDRLVEGY